MFSGLGVGNLAHVSEEFIERWRKAAMNGLDNRDSIQFARTATVVETPGRLSSSESVFA